MRLTYRNIDSSAAVTSATQSRWLKLRERHQRASDCRVAIESETRHKEGRVFTCVVSVQMPGWKPVVHHVGESGSHSDVYVTIREAFDALESRIDRHEGKLRARRTGRKAA